MVAYGVLEMKHKDGLTTSAPWAQAREPDDLEQLRKEDFERDQLRKLVNDELKRYGLLLQRGVSAKGLRWRTSMNHHVLYGQLQGTKGFEARPVLHEGTFQACCIHAAELLDDLDKAQETE